MSLFFNTTAYRHSLRYWIDRSPRIFHETYKVWKLSNETGSLVFNLTILWTRDSEESKVAVRHHQYELQLFRIMLIF